MCFNFRRKKEKTDKNMPQKSSDPEFKKPEDKTAEVNKPEFKKPEDKTAEVNKLEDKTSEVNKPEFKKPKVNKPEVIKPSVREDNAQNASLQANQTNPLKEENKSSEIDESLPKVQKKKDMTSNTSLFLLKPDHKKSAGTLYEVDRDVFKKEKERLDEFEKGKERLELNSFMYDFLSDGVIGGFIFYVSFKLSFNNIIF